MYDDEDGVRVISRGDVYEVLVNARAEFVSLLERHGLTVTRSADSRWWPIEKYQPTSH